jgi:hypothetical protein
LLLRLWNERFCVLLINTCWTKAEGRCSVFVTACIHTRQTRPLFAGFAPAAEGDDASAAVQWLGSSSCPAAAA